MTDRKLSPAYWLGRMIGEGAGRAVHRLLRPYIEAVEAAKQAAETECPPEDEDIPDCENCDNHGHCIFEPQAVYSPPPGYMLVRPGPPPHPWSVN